MIKEIGFVALGGGVGSVMRYLAAWVAERTGCAAAPVATLAVNVVGCLLIGLLAGWAGHQQRMDEGMRLLLMTGFCGGFTTFSTFSMENLQLFHAGRYWELGLYVAASVLLGFGAVAAGWFLAK